MKNKKNKGSPLNAAQQNLISKMTRRFMGNDVKLRLLQNSGIMINGLEFTFMGESIGRESNKGFAVSITGDEIDKDRLRLSTITMTAGSGAKNTSITKKLTHIKKSDGKYAYQAKFPNTYIPEAEDMGIDTFIRKSFRKSFREPVTETASYAPSPRRGRESARPHGALAGSSFQRDKMRASQPSLSYFMTHVGENFREMLLRLIDEKGFSDPYVYKKANLDRKLFSKIRCNPDYCPSRKTVIALAIALELTLDETADLLSRAGYAFSPGSKADLIVEFCILNKIYDIFEVDMLLFKYGQPTLG